VPRCQLDSGQLKLKPLKNAPNRRNTAAGNTENSDNDCLDVPRRFIDEGEDVHHVKKNADNASVDLPKIFLIQLG
jgi:hypothetical protein